MTDTRGYVQEPPCPFAGLADLESVLSLISRKEVLSASLPRAPSGGILKPASQVQASAALVPCP